MCIVYSIDHSRRVTNTKKVKLDLDIPSIARYIIHCEPAKNQRKTREKTEKN